MKAAAFGIVPLGKIRRGAALRLGLPPTETGGTLAIIEMASAASGLALVPPVDARPHARLLGGHRRPDPGRRRGRRAGYPARRRRKRDT